MHFIWVTNSREKERTEGVGENEQEMPDTKEKNKIKIKQEGKAIAMRHFLKIDFQEHSCSLAQREPARTVDP